MTPRAPAAPARKAPAAAGACRTGAAPASADARRLVDPARRRLSAGLAVAPLAACSTLAPDAMPVPAPAGAGATPRVRAGDRWRYVEINGYNGEPRAEIDCVVVQTAPHLQVRCTDSTGRARTDEVYQAPWRILVEPFYDLPQTFDAPLALLPEPPAVNAPSWLRTGYRVDGTGASLDWQERREAPRWERLRVPAGEFDALRIERRIFFTHADARRSQSVRIERLWYAPPVNRWVRREWTGEHRGWPIRRGPPAREDWIIQLLLAYAPGLD